MVGVGVEEKSLIRLSMENSCAALHQELQNMWAEIGESKSVQDKILLELEKECLQVYQRKVDEVNGSKKELSVLVAAKEAELTALLTSLGERNIYSQALKGLPPLKEQLAAISSFLEDLRAKKEERIKQFADIQSQIEKINAVIIDDVERSSVAHRDQDLTVNKLNEYQTLLRSLQKEKSDRLEKVLNHTNEIHSLCGILGLEFKQMVGQVHPNLTETSSEHATSISNRTLSGLHETIVKLKEEKKSRISKLRENVKSILELWKLMGSSVKEKKHFGRVKFILDSSDAGIAESGLLSLDVIEQIEIEVKRLSNMKISRMKDFVMKKRLELEEVCKRAHIEPDMSTAPERTTALIDSGLADPTELLSKIETQIMKSREESISRKDIMDRIDRWLVACEEENWLEKFNQDVSRYSAGKGAHLSLKRAEKARLTVTKIPAIVDNLIQKTLAWEDQKNMPFLYDGIRLISILQEYRLSRDQKEEAIRQYKERRKLHGFLEKGSVCDSKPTLRRSSSFSSRTSGYRMSGNEFMTLNPRKVVGISTPEPLIPQSYSCQHSRYLRDIRRTSSVRLDFVKLPREDTSSSFASISGSEPEPSSLGFE